MATCCREWASSPATGCCCAVRQPIIAASWAGGFKAGGICAAPCAAAREELTEIVNRPGSARALRQGLEAELKLACRIADLKKIATGMTMKRMLDREISENSKT